MWNLIVLFALAVTSSKSELEVRDLDQRPDTVQHRYAVLQLPDETTIEYWFGQMTIKNARGFRFLHFNDEITSGYLLESKPFEVNIVDSLFFRRSIAFSSPEKKLANKEIQIKPDSLVFNSRSVVKFIVEIEHLESKFRTSLDTVWCFTNALGEMRFRHSRFDTPFRRHDISMHAGTSRVLVRIDTNGIRAPLELEEIRHLDRQTAMNPYQTSIGSHYITVNGYDIDSTMSQYWSTPPPAKR